MLWVGITIFLIADAIYIAYWYFARRKRQKILALMAAERAYEPQYKRALGEFTELLGQDWYVCDRQYRLWKDRYKDLAARYLPSFAEIQTADSIKQLLLDFHERYTNGRKFI